MIPISAAPKRFVASVYKTGFSRSFSFKRALPLVHRVNTLKSTPGVSLLPFAAHSTHAASSRADMQPLSITIDRVSVGELTLTGSRPLTWWTGKAPVLGHCPGVSSDSRLHSLPMLSLDAKHCTRQSFQDYFDNTWALTETLLAGLQGEEAFMVSPYHDLRHPLIFYYGHPAVFYINKMRVAGLWTEPLNPYFEAIFEVGVDEMSWDDLSKNKMPWPSVAEVHAYRKKVYDTVSQVIQSLPESAFESINQTSKMWSLVMAMEHERIHLETSSVLISELPQRFVSFPEGVFPPYHPSAFDAPVLEPVAGQHFPVNEFIAVEEKEITLGKPADFPCFGWDNEYGARTFSVPRFEANKYKVSNGEYLQFVKDGGYSDRTLWSVPGWEWRSFRNAKWPFYWSPEGPQGLHQYNLRLVFDTVPMAWSWPVAVNFHEADAFARWKSRKEGKAMRVLTELEHQSIRDPAEQGAVASVDPVMQSTTKLQSNSNLLYSSMSPVNAFPPNAQGFHDVFGNAWEWTVDYFCALPGFQVHPYYEDFSTPCFDGLHNVIQGSSFVSTGNLASVFSRYHFRPHFLQHSSFRVARAVDSVLVTSDTDAPGPFVGRYPYRKSQAALEAGSSHEEESLQSKVNYHFASRLPQRFGLPASLLPPMRTIRDLVLQFAHNFGMITKDANVLEIGCGSGGLSYLLAKDFKGVVGIDHSHADVKFASSLRDGSVDASSIDCSDIELPVNQKNVEFRNSDPMCVPAELHGFDVVVISDVLDKVSSPNSVLGRLGGGRGLVRDGGLLVVQCAYQWNEDATPKSLWFSDSASNSTASAAELAQRLQPHFEVLNHTQTPFYWQVNSSELKGKLVQASVFRKKSTK